MKLEYPLNEALPNINHTRDRLLAKIFRFRKEEKEAMGATDEDFELLYAYGGSYIFLVIKTNADWTIALVTGQLAKEIDEVGKEIEKLFGVLDEELLKLQ